MPGCPCVLKGGYGKAGEGQATGLGGIVLCFSLAQLRDRKGAMADGLTAFSCLLLKPCLQTKGSWDLSRSHMWPSG